ncbi:MAG: inositol monophosphatase family protein [Planctomycetota bacterium]
MSKFEEELLSCAREAAREVGRMVLAQREGPEPIARERKAEGDFVTVVDLQAEADLRRILLARYPDHGFLGEESGGHRLDAEHVWIVDPIDGTSNYAAGLPQFAVSLACLEHGQPLVAAVHCAPEDMCYSALRSKGAWCEGQRLALADCPLDDASILGVQWLRGPNRLSFLPGLLNGGARIRVLGSSVTQLCDVASGRLQANLQEQGRIWDIAAAGLIAAEAGAVFTDWEGRDIFPFTDLSGARHYPSLAAPAAVHSALLPLLRAAKTG